MKFNHIFKTYRELQFVYFIISCVSEKIHIDVMRYAASYSPASSAKGD